MMSSIVQSGCWSTLGVSVFLSARVCPLTQAEGRTAKSSRKATKNARKRSDILNPESLLTVTALGEQGERRGLVGFASHLTTQELPGCLRGSQCSLFFDSHRDHVGEGWSTSRQHQPQQPHCASATALRRQEGSDEAGDQEGPGGTMGRRVDGSLLDGRRRGGKKTAKGAAALLPALIVVCLRACQLLKVRFLF
jgi:hypothetical protein